MWPWPASSRAARIAATRPSIMSLGQTISAPASAWLTAVRASNSSVASLSTSSPSGGPHDAVVVPGAGALGVLLVRDTKEHHRADPEPLELRRLGGKILDREPAE